MKREQGTQETQVGEDMTWDDDASLPVVKAERLDVRGRTEAPAHPKLVVLANPTGLAAEAVRCLYYALRRAQGGAPLGVLGVVSGRRGEGRTTLAANLAFCAARETGQPTALVDADLRAPSLHELAGVDGEVGLSDVIANRADLEAVAVDHAAGVTVIPGGRPEPEPARRFMSPRFARFLAQMRNRFDEIVVDLPPVAFADARLLAPQCSGVVLVVRAGVTRASSIAETVAALDGAKVLGQVVNASSEAAPMRLPFARKAVKALPGR